MKINPKILVICLIEYVCITTALRPYVIMMGAYCVMQQPAYILVHEVIFELCNAYATFSDLSCSVSSAYAEY
jgi:hypothetical protein